MNENEFDKKIRESAFANESRQEKPLWNKKGTWNRIESGLGHKNRTSWWKAAAIVLLFLSVGWSYAQWNNFRNFRIANETKLNEMQRELRLCAENSDNQVYANQTVIRNQKAEIDSLKAQLYRVGEAGRKRVLRKQVLVKNTIAESSVRKDDQQNLIDSLRTRLHLALQQKSSVETTSSAIVDKPEIVNPKIPAVVSPENRILYIGNQTLTPNVKKEKSFRIGIFGLSREENIEYKSDHSIFKK